MRKQQQRELQRLEEALMEADYNQEAFSADSDEFELDWEDYDESESYDVYNTDEVDVDMDEYSGDVHRGKQSSGLGVVLTMLAMVALSGCILFLLKYLGVL